MGAEEQGRGGLKCNSHVGKAIFLCLSFSSAAFCSSVFSSTAGVASGSPTTDASPIVSSPSPPAAAGAGAGVPSAAPSDPPSPAAAAAAAAAAASLFSLSSLRLTAFAAAPIRYVMPSPTGGATLIAGAMPIRPAGLSR